MKISIDLQAGEIVEVTYTYTTGGPTYGMVVPDGDSSGGNYHWHYNVTTGDVTFLSRSGGTFQNLALEYYCTTVDVTTLMQVNATGTVTLEVGGDRPANIYLVNSGAWCLLAKVIGKAY